MKTRIVPILACLIAVIGAAVPASADSYDAVSDFSSTLNSSATRWSYRYAAGTVRNGSYSLLPNYGSMGVYSPPDPGLWNTGAQIPLVGVNQSGGNVHLTIGPAFTWPNGTMLVHPGYGGLVVVSWLSPITAPVNISFSFSDLDPNGGGGINWFVERNNSSSTLGSGGFNNGGACGPQTLTGISVAAGDRINFIVDPKAAPEYDSTQLTATITQVPEPSTVALGLFALALCGLVLSRQRPSSYR